MCLRNGAQKHPAGRQGFAVEGSYGDAWAENRTSNTQVFGWRCFCRARFPKPGGGCEAVVGVRRTMAWRGVARTKIGRAAPRRRSRNRSERKPGWHQAAARTRPEHELVVLFGWHSVTAALANPRREIRKLWLTANAARRTCGFRYQIASKRRDRSASRNCDQAAGPTRSTKACLLKAAAATLEPRCGSDPRDGPGARPNHRSP